MKSTNQSGRTMLEMLGVLGIMGIITYGAIAGINYGMSSYKINQTYSEIQDIIQGIEDLYSWSKEYKSRSEMMAAACENDIFSNSKSCSSDDTVEGPFGKMWIEPIVEKGRYTNFRIRISVADSTDCSRLVQMDWKANNINCTNGNENVLCTCQAEGNSTTLYFSPL